MVNLIFLAWNLPSDSREAFNPGTDMFLTPNASRGFDIICTKSQLPLSSLPMGSLSHLASAQFMSVGDVIVCGAPGKALIWKIVGNSLRRLDALDSGGMFYAFVITTLIIL